VSALFPLFRALRSGLGVWVFCCFACFILCLVLLFLFVFFLVCPLFFFFVFLSAWVWFLFAAWFFFFSFLFLVLRFGLALFVFFPSWSVTWRIFLVCVWFFFSFYGLFFVGVVLFCLGCVVVVSVFLSFLSFALLLCGIACWFPSLWFFVSGYFSFCSAVAGCVVVFFVLWPWFVFELVYVWVCSSLLFFLWSSCLCFPFSGLLCCILCVCIGFSFLFPCLFCLFFFWSLDLFVFCCFGRLFVSSVAVGVCPCGFRGVLSLLVLGAASVAFFWFFFFGFFGKVCRLFAASSFFSLPRGVFVLWLFPPGVNVCLVLAPLLVGSCVVFVPVLACFLRIGRIGVCSSAVT